MIEGIRALQDVQFSAIDALVAVLEPTIPELGRNKWRFHDPNVTISPYSPQARSIASQLQVIAANVSLPAHDQEQNNIPSVTQSLAALSQLVASPSISIPLPPHDLQLVEHILSVLTHASTLSRRPEISTQILETHRQHPTPGSELADFRQTIAHLFQTSALDDLSTLDPRLSNPVLAVELSLAATHLGDTALALLNELTSRLEHPRASSTYRLSHDSELPPEYEHDPPAYGFQLADDDKFGAGKIRHVQSAPDLGRVLQLPSTSTASAEKMQIDLDDVTHAIERMYTVTPQIRSQRVELDVSKRQELELARIMGSVQRLGNRLDAQRAQGRAHLRPTEADIISTEGAAHKGKGRADDTTDLEDFLEIISKAQRPRLSDQRANVSAELSSRLRRMEYAKTHEVSNVSSSVLRRPYANLNVFRNSNRRYLTRSSKVLRKGDCNLKMPFFPIQESRIKRRVRF